MSDLIILRILESRSNYERFSKYINNISPEVSVILKDMGKYFSVFPTKDEVNWSSFRSWFKFSEHLTMSSERHDVFSKIFDNIEDEDYDEDDATALIVRFIDRSYADAIATAATKIADGEVSVTLDDIRDVLDKRDAELPKEDEGFAVWGNPITNVRGTIRWRLNELNASVGPIGKGDLIVVGARPDSGKTTFLAAEATHFASQLHRDSRILWLNNEERSEKVQARIITAALGIAYTDIEMDWASAYEMYKKAINGDVDKIILKDVSGAYTAQITKVVDSVKPDVIIFDQLRKVHGFEKAAGNDTMRQEMVFNWARELAHKYAPVITVHQADGTADGQMYIEMGQLHMSKTGIQGEADAIINIGRPHDGSNKRGIYIPKNKMQGDDPTVRNAKWDVMIEPEIARFKGVL